MLRSFWLNGVALRLVIYGLFAILIRDNPVAIPLALALLVSILSFWSGNALAISAQQSGICVG